VYDLEGRYLRTFGEDFLNSPSGFAQWGDILVVAELFARLVALDSEDHLIGYIGAGQDLHTDQSWPDRPAWPNSVDRDGLAQPPPEPQSDEFNSPHSMAVDADGNLYVSEWLIGGRYTKLTVLPH
jgi:hypothetical protein